MTTDAAVELVRRGKVDSETEEADMGVQGRKPVVVGVDGSESAWQATRWAAREAALRKLPLHVVYALGWPSEPYSAWNPGYGSDSLRRAEEHGRSLVAEAARIATEVAPGVEVEQRVVTGFPIPRLTELSRDAGLLVLGSRGRGGVAGLLTGSVTVALAAHSACPLVVVREGTDRTDGPVVVGVDGSPLSEAAVAFAFDAAALRGAPLLAVHAWNDVYLAPEVAIAFDWDAVAEEERALLSERLAGWGAKYPDVPVQRLVVADFPARTLVEQSAKAQLVVVGSHGRGGLTGLVLGSVSQALLHRAECPVAVVRTERGQKR